MWETLKSHLLGMASTIAPDASLARQIVEARNACIDVLPSIARLPESRLNKPSTARTF